MPLDEFQKSVIAVVSRNRDSGSPFVGGAVIQQHGFRLTEDQDIFTAGDEQLDDLVQADRAALEAAGFAVHPRRGYSGFRECTVVKPMTGTSVLQWTAALAREFYAPVPDPQFGHRLHLADLAVNKALAAASRMKKRDFVDLWMLDRHVMPLWRMACGAPGKDTDLNPFSVIERISFNWSITARRNDPSDWLVLTVDVPLEEIGGDLRNAMRDARLVLPDVQPEHYGRLQIDEAGRPVVAREITQGGAWKAPEPGGALPAFADADSEMIAGLIAEYGPEGSRYTGSPTEEAFEDSASGPFDIPKTPSPCDG